MLVAGEMPDPDPEPDIGQVRVRIKVSGVNPSDTKTRGGFGGNLRLMIHGGADPCNDPSTSEGEEAFFTSTYSRLVLEGVGHFPQREAPHAVSAAILEFLQSQRPNA